jgi:2,6-dihydroxypyridine 3-monooxygenase
VHQYEGARAVVVGGSFGGLTSALLLRKLGFSVDVFERSSTPLENRGGGIVLQPITMKWFDGHSARRINDLSTGSSHVRYLGPDNAIVHDEPAEWRYSSWGTVYRALLSDFGREHYHLGEFCAGFAQDAGQVELRFVTGRVERADLVVFADGITSTARRRLFPDLAPHYSGYVGWRGTVREDAVTQQTRDLLADALTYSLADRTHAVMYLIPGMDGELDPGRRLFNYVWYRNVPAGPELHELTTDTRGYECPVSVHPGDVQRRYTDELREAAAAQLSRPRSPRSWPAPSSPTCKWCSTPGSRPWPTAGSPSSATRRSRPGRTPRPEPPRPPPTPGSSSSTSPPPTGASRRPSNGGSPDSSSWATS